MFALSLSFLGPILHAVNAAFGTLILSGLVGLIGQGLKKLHINLRQSQQDALVQAIEDGIALATEKSAVASKAGTPLSSGDKVKIASGYVLAQGVAQALTPEQVNDLIQIVLAKSGAGATEVK